MPTSNMLNKNYYSHCPLKKRPIKKETSIDGHEPENLSTKPEDLHQNSQKFMAAFEDVKNENLQKFAETPAANFLWPVPGLHANFYPFQLYTALLPHRELLSYTSHAKLSRDKSLSPPAPAFIEPIKLEKANINHDRESSFHHRLLPLSPTSDHLSYSSFTSQSVPFRRMASAKILTDFKIATLLKSTTEKEKVLEVKKVETMRYQCPDCKKSYSTCSGLVKHQQFHCITSDEKKVQKLVSCDECGKVYASTGALKMHIRTHTLPCKCHLCGKAFSRPWLLQGHIRTHTGEKPFSCNHCHRAFADRSNLRAHLQTHSDVKKYSCAVCNKTFSRMSLLIKHNDSGCPIKIKLS